MVLGITGISGSGKHTAANWFEKQEWVVLDADKIAHHLYRPYTHVWKAIVDRFGEDILTTSDRIDRQKLAAIVFSSDDPVHADGELRALNEIVHPSIKRHLVNEIHRYFRRKSNIVVVAALFEQLEMDEICDKVLHIKAPIEVAQDRIQRRDGITQAMYLRRVDNQTEPESPNYEIENVGSKGDFYKELEKLNLV